MILAPKPPASEPEAVEFLVTTESITTTILSARSSDWLLMRRCNESSGGRNVTNIMARIQ